MSVRIQRAAKRTKSDVGPSDPGKYIREFVISTESVDRHNTTFALSGWDLKAYRNNPIVLDEHDASKPALGKALEVKKVDGELRAVVEFLPPEVNPRTAVVMAQIDAGIMGASVGADVLELEYNADRETGDEMMDLFLRPPLDFRKQELVELSVVQIGSNKDAVPIRENEETLTTRGLYVSQATRDIAPDVVYRLRKEAHAKRTPQGPGEETEKLPNLKPLEVATPPQAMPAARPSAVPTAPVSSPEEKPAEPPANVDEPTEEEVKAVVQEVAKAVVAELLKHRNQKTLDTTGRLPSEK